ncbi:Aldo/keto reductase [Tilletiaria anomala UBC 951]|uniref:Aldo/keto reductase n=1 Tax=Tilletiaria anomala (strain ATCC 24038 / CBS 436.72 / UBC 951) TaxID=1037660 RepID=A0A066VEY6_TILAU|nr:Aldo/keto reductase [Tilletiaria anomala UBC 951]KDN40031.1 Aldo/keto reductase [Tilletiaria anomala UBC 951]
MSTPRVPLIFGTMTISRPGTNGCRIGDKKEAQEIIDTYSKYGNELDTARMYGEGTTEEYLADLDTHGDAIDTKVYPVQAGDHSPAKLRATFEKSLAALKVSCVRTLYLHAPDRSVPFDETCAEVDKLHSEGKFQQFGLSNFAAWEVAEVVGICKAKGYIQPTIYQSMYNAITRSAEEELFPACRKYGLRVVVYNPIAGGFFAGKLVSESSVPEPGSRFDPSSQMGTMYRARYVKGGYFAALEHLKPVTEKHALRLTELALRWLQHHSKLTEKDGVILGASSNAQLEQNCQDSLKGPLPEEVVQALDEAWMIVKPHAPMYWR